MKICKICKTEYLDHIENCPDCSEPLISADEASTLPIPDNEHTISQESFNNGEVVALIQGGLSSCREIESKLKANKIPAIIVPKDLKAKDNAATLGSSQCMTYILAVKEADVEKCQAVLEGKFLNDVRMEGTHDFKPTTVDLEKGTIACPACGESGELDNGECKSCGLFLGEL